MCHVDRSEKATWTKQKWRETSESTPRRIYYVLTELYKNQSDKPLLFNRSRVTSPSFGCRLPLAPGNFGLSRFYTRHRNPAGSGWLDGKLPWENQQGRHCVR